jgi:hypothetical protein
VTRNEMAELPIEDLGPECIGWRIEVDDGQGATVGFRLGRYEKTTVDEKPQWLLFSDQPAWKIKLLAGAKIRWVLPTAADVRGASRYQQSAAGQHTQPPAAPVTVPQPSPGSRGPQSWVTPPPRG